MKKSEKLIQHEIHTGLTGNTHLFRNNVGTATTSTGSVIKFGLCRGSSDLIGWTSVEITPEMVGRTVAVFTALEVKSATGRASQVQKDFIKRVHDCGGIAGVVRSVSDAVAVVNSFKSEKK